MNFLIYRDYAVGSFFRDTLIPGAYGIFTERNNLEVNKQSEYECVFQIFSDHILLSYKNKYTEFFFVIIATFLYDVKVKIFNGSFLVI